MKSTLRFLKLFSVSLLWILVTSPAFAQLSEGGTPPSFIHKAPPQAVKQSSPPQLYVTPIDFSVEELIKEDAVSESYGHPPRLGKIIDTRLSMSDGYWTTLENGQQIWRLNIQAPGAIAMMLYYDEFYIPKGGKLFIYNKAQTHVLGAYTENTNLWGREFATEFVAGDELTLEYVAPVADLSRAAVMQSAAGETIVEACADFPRLKISGISYGYNHLEVFQRSEGIRRNAFGSAGTCYVNINCSPEGDSWQDQKKGVVRMLIQVDGATASCSGSLINNTAQDLAPYLLSANHCVDGLPETSYNSMVFYFNYESSGCESGTTEPVHKTMVGAESKVLLPMATGHSDGALLLLKNTVPAEYDPYWNGWDRSSRAPSRGAAIHHPAGDIKKISIFTNTPQITQYSSTSALNGHFQFAFSITDNGYSTVEGGSSGCPLFNEAGLIVGSLSGGDAGCKKPYGPVLFGRLWYHWDQGPANNQMKTYLDPGNTGVTSLQGRYAADMLMVNFTMDKTTVYASEAIQFIDRSYGAESYLWTFEGGTPSTSTEKNPKITYNTPGHYKVELTINKGTVNERVATPAYIDCVQKKASCPEYVTVGAGSSKSQFPLGLQHKHVMSSAIYTKEDLNNKSGVITELAWYADTYLSSYRTMFIYLKEVDETTQTASGWEDEIAGATLVYSGNTAFYNYNYWNKFTLDNPFTYSGTKNLKVLVYTRAAVSATGSSGCRYSTASSTHMEWTFAEQVNTALAGTVTGNRPNIKVTFDEGCPATAPVADFSVQIQENFENLTFPPRLWKMEAKGEVQTMWQRGLLSNLPSTVIDNTIGSNSAIIISNAKEADSWLVSKPYYLPSNAKAEFYAGYDPKTLSKAALSLYVSTDDGQTWGTAKWTTGTTDINEDWYWRQQIVDLSAYADKEVRLAWQYKGAGGNVAGIDGLKIYSTDNIIYINEGDGVVLMDKTTGPPMQWSWTTTGGNSGGGTAQNITVQYNTVGEYNISLTTKNNLGENTLSLPNAVRVIGKKPVQAILTNVPNLFPGYNKFISQYNSRIAFADAAVYKPTSWQWTFPGGTPSSSTEQSTEEIRYPKQAGSYSVTLKTANATGSTERTFADFVVAGSKDWVWNIQEGETAENVYVTNNGYMTGNNNIGNWCFAELFDINTPGELTKLKIAFHKGPAADGYVAFWIARKEIIDEFDGNDWLKELLMDEIQVPVSAINPTGYTEIVLPRTIAVPGAFYVLVGNFTRTTKDLAIKSSSLRLPGRGNVKIANLDIRGNRFTDLGLISLYGYDLSLNMAAEVRYTNLRELTPAEMMLPDKGASKTVNVGADFDWTASTVYPWLHINNSNDTLKGSNDASFSVTCDDNAGGPRVGYIIFSGGGHKRTITVRQAGTNDAVALSANLSPTSKKDVDLTWMSKESLSKKDNSNDSGNHPVVLANNVPAREPSPSWSVANRSVQNTGNEEQPSVITTTAEQPLSVKRNITFTSKRFTANNTIAPKAVTQSPTDNEKIGSKLHWCSETLISYQLIGFSAGGTYKDGSSLMAGAKWEASELTDYKDLTISKVNLFIGTANRVILRIFQGGEEVYSQEILAYTEKDYTEITLERPVAIDVTKDLIIAFDADHQAGQLPAALDKNSYNKGKGDLVWFEEEKKWYPLTEAAGSTYVGNWYIIATIGSKDGKFYKLYRDGQEIATTSELTFTDKNLLVKGEVCYTVRTFFDDSTLSVPSNRACVFMLGQTQSITFDPIGDKYATHGEFALTATATSGLPVRFESNNPAVANIFNQNQVKIFKEGTVKITVYQDGNEVYRAASPVTQTLTILPALADPSQLVATEAFSPNGDGLNDYFTIQGIELFPDNELTVFDESGRIHYLIKGYNNTFDGIANHGKYKGQKLPPGTYYYILKVNGKAEKRSFVVIKY